MVYTCFLCKWRSNKLPRRSYHKFPSNEELKQKWLGILGKNNISIGTRTSLCSLHFEENCFRYGLVNGRKILKEGSLPTLHLTNNHTRNESIDLVGEVKLESQMESSLDTGYPTTANVQIKDPTSELNIDDHWMNPSTSEWNVENNFVKAPKEIYSSKESSRESTAFNEKPDKDEVLHIKKKDLTLKPSVKHLHNSKSQIKSQLSKLTKRLNKYEAKNKLLHYNKMTEEQEVATESCEGTSDTFASVWVKVEMSDGEADTENMEIKPDIKELQKLIKPRKKNTPRTPAVLLCEQCPYTSIYKHCLKLHVMSHINNKPFSCDTCSYTTKYPTSLQRHMFIKHQVIGEDNKTLLYCDACDYSTYYKWNLNSHKRRHATNKLFQCEHCSYSTAYRHNFVKHSRVHNKMNREYKCDKCPFVTKFTGHIQRHMSQIHNEVSEKASACDFCNFTTMVRWRLNVHKQRSRQENPLKCGRCNFQTHYMCESKKHKKTHFNELFKAGTVKGGSYGNEHSSDEIAGNLYGLNQNRKHNSDTTDRTSKDYFKAEMVNGINNGGNDTLGQINYTNELNDTDTTKGFLKDEAVNLYNLVQGANENLRHIGDENEYNDSVRMTEGFLKSVNLFDIVNEGNRNHESLQVNDINRTMDAGIHHHFMEQNITTNGTTKRTSNSKLNKVKNYLVDPKCETRKTIQVLESDDAERPFQCVKCAYTSKFKAAVIRHYQRLHTSENKPFKCCNCDFSTKTQDQISLHNKRSQAEGTLICNICNFTTNFKCSYVMHQKTHYAHKCTICDYSCRNKYDIQKHFTTVHLGEGMKCRFCDYKSGRRESLLCHEAIHTGNKPFKCELCDYQSVRRSLLDVHFRRCHGNAKVPKNVCNGVEN